jgi:peroxiredoxin
MSSRIAALLVLSLSVLAPGQSAPPTTRPSTAGAIAPAIGDVGPLQTGAAVPELTLVAPDGTAVELRAAIRKRPTLLIFYRGGWCQNCTRQLRGIDGVLPELSEAGYQVLAISPDKPERLRGTIEDFRLTYPLLSDVDGNAMKAFGIAYAGAAGQFAILEQASGASHHALPVPTIYLLSTDGGIRFAHFDPDYKNKMSYSDIVVAAKAALAR